MAQPTNTFDTYDMIGIFDDLEDVIYDISPTETPFLSMAPRMKATQTNHEWQTDSLAAASAVNAVIEGDDATTDAQTATARVGNYTQISDKVILVTGTSRAVQSAGRGDELDYLIAKAGKELKRDMESQITQNRASVAGNSTTARVSGSMESWLTTNDDRGAGGAQGGFSAGVVAAPTDGTQRALTESIHKNVIKLVWTSGGDPDTILVGPFNKQVISGFTGNATRFVKAETNELVAGIDVYKSDFGEHKVVPSRFNRDRTALYIDSEYIGVAYLRPFQTAALAKTGDSERRQLLAEYTLVCKNEAAHGVAADLTTS